MALCTRGGGFITFTTLTTTKKAMSDMKILFIMINVSLLVNSKQGYLNS